MHPENENFKRAKPHNKQHNKYNPNYQNISKVSEDDHAIYPTQFLKPIKPIFSNNKSEYSNKSDYQTQYAKQFYPGQNRNQYAPVHQAQYSNEGNFKGVLFEVNGEKLRVYQNEDLNEPRVFDKLVFFVDKLKIHKQFEKDALLLKLIKEMELKNFALLDKRKYFQILDQFICNSIDMV